jgi:type IV secretion system protein VirB5
VYADGVADAILAAILGKDGEILLNSIEQIKSLSSIKDGLDKGLLGTHGYGGKFYDSSSYDWGSQADDWQTILAMSKNRNGSGSFADMVGQVTKRLPMQSNLGSNNPLENDYYDLQASTAIATRSGSELAFNQAAKNEKNIRQLHREIDQTQDAKSAADLNNRLSSENAMLNVQQTKLLAMIAQQAAVEAQARSIRAEEDKSFFYIK